MGKLDLEFVCKNCGVGMPYIPAGKKCVNCGADLTHVLTRLFTVIGNDRLEATPAKWRSENQKTEKR